MITVISINEYKELLQKGRLSKSENTKFIDNNDLREVIIKQLKHLTKSDDNDFITILAGVSGNMDNDLTKKYSNEILLKLPRPDEPVYVVLPDSLSSLRIGVDNLSLVNKLDLADNQLMNVALSMFTTEQSKVAISYAFISCIESVSIKEIVYDASLSDKINALRSEYKNTKILYSPLSIF